MDALECIATRRSIRRFLNVPVDFETQMTIVEAGLLAPSAGNIQGWRFVIIDDKELQKKIAIHSLNQECIHNAAFLVVVSSDPEEGERQYGLRGARLYAVQDCAASIQNMLLAAHALGIGGVWVGAFDEEKIRTLLAIPQSVRPQAVIAFGYPGESPDKKRVRDMSSVVFFNKYGTRVKNMHRLLKDYSVDWEKRVTQAHNTIQRVAVKTIEKSKELSTKVGEEGGSVFKRYQEKIKERLKKKE